MCKLLHLVSLNGNSHRVDQLITASKSSCKILLSEEVSMIRKIFASSVNSRHTLLTISGISLINITSSVGPRTEPCGIPLLTHAQEMKVPLQRRLVAFWHSRMTLPSYAHYRLYQNSSLSPGISDVEQNQRPLQNLCI